MPKTPPTQPSLFDTPTPAAPKPAPAATPLALQAPAASPALRPAVIHAFTDGACSGNPGPGGWGVVIKIPGQPDVELSGAAKHTTNNRMELSAALALFRHISATFGPNQTLHLTTDSQYVLKGATEWLAGWRRKGWRTATGKPVENKELWEDLAAAMAPHKVTWHWIRGHTGHTENERADQLAVTALKTLPK